MPKVFTENPLTPDHIGSLGVAQLYALGMTDVRVVIEGAEGSQSRHAVWCDTSDDPFDFSATSWSRDMCKHMLYFFLTFRSCRFSVFLSTLRGVLSFIKFMLKYISIFIQPDS